MLSPDGATRPGHGCYPAVMSSHVGPPLLSLRTIGEEPSPVGGVSRWRLLVWVTRMIMIMTYFTTPG
jgi:hypothetical protein